MLEAAVCRVHGNDYSILSVRLASYFSLPYSGRLSVVSLAIDGFYYVGSGDEVACFCCGLMLTLGNRTLGVNLLAEHRQRSAGRCDFVNRRTPPSSTNAVISSAADCALTAYADLPSMMSASFDQLLNAPVTVPSLTSSPAAADNNASVCELQRLATFVFDDSDVYPSRSRVSPSILARAGFYYAGPGVQCAFCQGLLRNWEHGDRTVSLHAGHSTCCQFAQGHDVGNVPIPFWPLILAPQSTDSAPDAAGERDASTCLQCGGTVVNRPQGSDPMAEHARRCPTCSHVMQLKGGTRFIEEQRLQRSGHAVEFLDAGQAERFDVDLNEIRARMDSPMVRVLLRMDYPFDLVRKVIRKRLETVGRDHETSEELLADVFATHDKEQRTSIAAEDNRQLKNQLTCKICMDSVVEVVFLPCCHAICCGACEPAFLICPMCRTAIRGITHLIF